MHSCCLHSLPWMKTHQKRKIELLLCPNIAAPIMSRLEEKKNHMPTIILWHHQSFVYPQLSGYVGLLYYGILIVWVVVSLKNLCKALFLLQKRLHALASIRPHQLQHMFDVKNRTHTQDVCYSRSFKHLKPYQYSLCLSIFLDSSTDCHYT